MNSSVCITIASLVCVVTDDFRHHFCCDYFLNCHRCRGVTPGEADMHYLDNAKKLSMYGVHLFPAKV